MKLLLNDLGEIYSCQVPAKSNTREAQGYERSLPYNSNCLFFSLGIENIPKCGRAIIVGLWIPSA